PSPRPGPRRWRPSRSCAAAPGGSWRPERMAAMPAPLVPPAPGPERPVLELSGPKLGYAFETLALRCEEHGGIEHWVAALGLKARLFRDALAGGAVGALDLHTARALC